MWICIGKFQQQEEREKVSISANKNTSPKSADVFKEDVVCNYFLFWGGGGTGDRGRGTDILDCQIVWNNILESVQYCLMPQDEEMWKYFTGFWKALTAFTVGPKLILWKTSPEYGESSLPKKVHILRICSTFFDTILSFLPLLSAAKHYVRRSKAGKSSGLSLQRLWLLRVFLFSLMLSKPINIFMWD